MYHMMFTCAFCLWGPNILMSEYFRPQDDLGSNDMNVFQTGCHSSWEKMLLLMSEFSHLTFRDGPGAADDVPLHPSIENGWGFASSSCLMIRVGYRGHHGRESRIVMCSSSHVRMRRGLFAPSFACSLHFCCWTPKLPLLRITIGCETWLIIFSSFSSQLCMTSPVISPLSLSFSSDTQLRVSV